jgi:RNA polymerase sigma-70 factor, ECF subfamily
MLIYQNEAEHAQLSAVAVAMADGPLAGLVLLDQPEMQQALSRYHLFHAARTDLLQRAGRLREASSAYREALTLCQNEHDRIYLHRRLTEVSEAAS